MSFNSPRPELEVYSERERERERESSEGKWRVDTSQIDEVRQEGNWEKE